MALAPGPAGLGPQPGHAQRCSAAAAVSGTPGPPAWLYESRIEVAGVLLLGLSLSL